MALSDYNLNDKQRETCAVLNMRNVVAKISKQQDVPYEEALLLFTESPVYDTLFDFETGIWRESPEYLLDLWNEQQNNNNPCLS